MRCCTFPVWAPGPAGYDGSICARKREDDHSHTANDNKKNGTRTLDLSTMRHAAPALDKCAHGHGRRGAEVEVRGEGGARHAQVTHAKHSAARSPSASTQ